MKDDGDFRTPFIPDKSDPTWRARLAADLRWRARAQPGLSDAERAKTLLHARRAECVDWLKLPLAESAWRKEKRAELQRVFENAASGEIAGAREELAYRHMIVLADVFEGWGMDSQASQRRTAQLLGWAESLRRLAHEVGPDWDPPKPEQLSMIGFMGRQLLSEV